MKTLFLIFMLIAPSICSAQFKTKKDPLTVTLRKNDVVPNARRTKLNIQTLEGDNGENIFQLYKKHYTFKKYPYMNSLKIQGYDSYFFGYKYELFDSDSTMYYVENYRELMKNNRKLHNKKYKAGKFRKFKRGQEYYYVLDYYQPQITSVAFVFNRKNRFRLPIPEANGSNDLPVSTSLVNYPAWCHHFKYNHKIGNWEYIESLWAEADSTIENYTIKNYKDKYNLVW